MTDNDKSFEKSIARLSEIVSHLEKGDMPLGDSLTLFEEGTALIKRCSRMLDEAEQKVMVIRKGEDGLPEEHPFETES